MLPIVGLRGYRLAAYHSWNRIVQTLLRSAAWLALALSSYWTLRLAWADDLSSRTELAARERAVHLAPISAFIERLASRREELGGDALPDLVRAATLDPENPERLMRVALAAEVAGNYPLAEKSLLAAAARSRLYQPKYLLAQFYYRRQDAGRFWPWARQALETAYGDAAPLFELCWRMRPDAVWLRANAIPPKRELAGQYLAYLARRELWAAAALEAHRMLPAADIADLPSLLSYCEAQLGRGDGRESVEIWNALCRRRLLADDPLDPAAGRLVTNGGFLHAPSGRGFDWQMLPQTGVSATAAAGAIRIDFTGHQPERCPVLWQFVPTVPGALYRLRYEVHTATDRPATGITLEVSDTTTRAESANCLRFVAAKELTQVLVTYRRVPGSSRLEDTAWLTRVQMERVP